MLDCRKSESSFKILYWIKGISCNYSKVWVTGTESGGRLDNPVSSVFFPPPTSPVQKAWAEFCVSSAGFGGNSSKQKCPCRETEYWPEGKGAQESPFTVVYGEGKSAQGWCSTEVLNTLISLTSLLCWVTRLTSCSLLLSLTSLHTHTHTHTHTNTHSHHLTINVSNFKNLPASAGDARDRGSVPASGISPAWGNGNPLQHSCLGNLMDRGTWRATIHGFAKSQTQLSDWASNFMVKTTQCTLNSK